MENNKIYLLQYTRNNKVMSYSTTLYTSKAMAQKIADDYNNTEADLTCTVVEMAVDTTKTVEELFD